MLSGNSLLAEMGKRASAISEQWTPADGSFVKYLAFTLSHAYLEGANDALKDEITRKLAAGTQDAGKPSSLDRARVSQPRTVAGADSGSAQEGRQGVGERARDSEPRHGTVVGEVAVATAEALHAKESRMSQVLEGAAEVTGLIQQAVERLHQLTTYEMSSAQSSRHGKKHEQVRKLLVDARNEMAGLSLTLGKEHA